VDGARALAAAPQATLRLVPPPGPEPGAAHRAAVVDLGSNSWRLVMFDYVPGAWWKRTDELCEPIRIAAGMAKSGRLDKAAIRRGVATLDVFSRLCRIAGLRREDVDVVATSAIRDAANADALAAFRAAAPGLDIQVASAEEEAIHGYHAAVNSTTLRDGTVVDLGGGSMQLVAVRRRRPAALGSWPLGAVRVTERLLPGAGPVSRKQLARVRAEVRRELEDAPWLGKTGGRLVGVGGGVRTLAVAAQRAHDMGAAGVQGFVLTPALLDELVETLAALPALQRGTVPGIKPARADIILASAVVLQTVVELAGFDGLEVTQAGLREGVFFANRLLAGGEPLVGDVRSASVRNLAAQYDTDLEHVEHVAGLALQMRDSLLASGDATLDPQERELLWAAAMLHDLGTTIDFRDHHKHSRYLILNAGLPGFDPRELALIALIAGYHRKGMPHLDEFESLMRPGDLGLVRRCAVILRLAEHLERGNDRCVRGAVLKGDPAGIYLELEVDGNAALARWSVERYGEDEAFRRAFGRPLVVASSA
jgi:exopolyphosphatase/guanosine-5'-triphosphate,3'-diphosphate pyrophosphatase